MNIIYEPAGRAREYAHLALNHYTGCDHGCTYCYIPHIPWIDAAEFRSGVKPKKDVLTRVGKDAKKLSGTDRRVLLCFACDPYPDCDAASMLTRKVLRILRDNDVPFTVLTKSGLLPLRDFDLYRRGIDAFGVTLTTPETAIAAEVEPNAGLPIERIGLLAEAHSRGISTWVSLEPVLDPVESYKAMIASVEHTDLYKIGTLNHVKCDTTPAEWRAFATRAINYCVAHKRRVYIKKDLAGYLGEFPFENTDDRVVLASD